MLIADTTPTPALIAETAQWIVLNKPAGWLSIPGRGESCPVLTEWLARTYGKIWVIHRLDRETSGVIVFARTEEAHRLANGWFGGRQVKKEYHGIVQGRLRAPHMKINQPVGELPSLTQVEAVESWDEATLVRLIPMTGRRHQIRIHLSSRKYPLWGDRRYGGPTEVMLGEKNISVTRVGLHAGSLRFPNGEAFAAPFPDDFNHWLGDLRKFGSRS